MQQTKKVDKELEKIRAENKKLIEQWEKTVHKKATKIAHLLNVIKTSHKSLKIIENNSSNEDMFPSADEIWQISKFLAESIYPNPLKI